MTYPLKRSRRGFTLIELTVGTLLTVTILGIVAGTAVWSFRERTNQRARFIALETAHNVLEEARSLPWTALTEKWAQAHSLSEDPFLPEGKLTVTVADEPEEKGLKRVVAHVAWRVASERPLVDVELVGFFAAASENKKGDAK